jgi:hypothetical protein
MRERSFRLWPVILSLSLLAAVSMSSCSQVIRGSKGDPISPTEEMSPAGPTLVVLPPTSIEGVSFELNPALASGAHGEIVPEDPGSKDGPYWAIHPRYVSIFLDGYSLSDTLMSPGIYVYPVEDFGRLSSQAGGILENLKDFLAQKPVDADQIPFLPIFNAGQIFHSNMDWIDFQSGTGVRFLTIYAQYPAPVNNEDIFYTYQGLTRDGRHSVSIILPVNHPSLRADLNAFSESDMEEIHRDYDQYRADMAAMLSNPSNSSLFVPDLAALDAFVASLTVER